jgi:CRISPR-associated protein Csd2
MPSPIVSRRHDIFVMFDVTNGNPNGDPDAGNLPRIDPTTNKGLVSDVCLKRKVRNFVTPLEISITRCAVTKPEDEKKERTMGNKHIVPYALYVAKAFVSPVFAERTGFTEDDLGLFFEALHHMFDHDQSAARAEMTVRGIYDFEHVGTQEKGNDAQNAREAKLGCAHAWQLFEGVKIELKKDADGRAKDYPESFADYSVTDNWLNDAPPTGIKGVKLTRRVDPR